MLIYMEKNEDMYELTSLPEIKMYLHKSVFLE